MVLSKRRRIFKHTRSRRKSRRSRRSCNRMKGGSQLKIAIFFAGRIAAYQHVLHKLLEIKNTYNPLIFCSLNNESDKAEDVAIFCKVLNIPVEQCNIEKTIVPEWVERSTVHNKTGMYSMFYHQNKAFTHIEQYQKQNSMHFDCILYYRADMDSKDKLVLNTPEINTVYIPNDREYDGYNDRMAYGNYESMKLYSNLINSLEKILRDNPSVNNPEVILKKYLENTELKVSKIPYNTDLHPLRNNKDITGQDPSV